MASNRLINDLYVVVLSVIGILVTSWRVLLPSGLFLGPIRVSKGCCTVRHLTRKEFILAISVRDVRNVGRRLVFRLS